ncbi:MAG: peptide ABC transporter substrate-binding protein [Patescibacteria group bacterium]
MSSRDFLKRFKIKPSSLFKKIKKTFSFVNFKQKGPLSFFKKNIGNKKYDKDLVASLSKKRWPKLRQLKYIPDVISKKEWLVFRIAALVFVVSLLAFLICGWFKITHIVPAVGGAYTEGLVGMPKFINPLYTSLNDVDQDIASLIYPGLVKIDKHQQIVPDMAESWTVSDDQKEYTFYLRDGLRWHDGESLTIDDVVFTIESIQDSEFKSPLAVNFANVKLEVLDEKTIKFILPESYAVFLENLTVGILPSHLWLEVVPANALLTDYNLRPIGSGPYKFKSLTKDKLGNIKVYTLERNRDYAPTAHLKQINFKFYPDFASAAMALKSHNIDGMSYLPKDLEEETKTRKDLTYYNLSLPQYTGVFFNQAKNKALESLNVRQALTYALEKDTIVSEALRGEGQVIDAPILAGFIGYNPNIEKYAHDDDKAGELLDEAGWKFEEKDEEENTEDSGAILFRKKDDIELKVILTTVNRSENFKVAQLIQKMWQSIGVKVEIKIIEAGQIQSDVIRKRNFEALLFGEIFGTDPDPYPFWHSSQAGENGLNLANFVNKEADKVLEEARQISDPQKRHDKYIHFQNILNKNLPAIFLYTPKYVYPMSNKIKGMDVKVISVPCDRFSSIEEWYIDTKRSF